MTQENLHSEFPVLRASELAEDTEKTEWLIESLWGERCVGVVGGPPKCCKSWLTLELAVSLASKTPCLGRYNPRRTGRVLLYAAEDSKAIVKQRLESLCRARNVLLSLLEIYLITENTMRLDKNDHQEKLRNTIMRLNPDILILDPLVRLHHLDENSAPEVSLLLSYLRELERAFHLSILLVHHARKNGSSTNHGYSLRGSGDIYAWCDCYIDLRRNGENLIMRIEHRSAKSPEPVSLMLVGEKDAHLEIADLPASDSQKPREMLLRLLRSAQRPMKRTELREQIKIRNESLGQLLLDLDKEGMIEHLTDGYVLKMPEEDRSRSPI
jgi:RecA-family ATPase